jgi:hypothetical protein
MTAKLMGGCQCGHVRYVISGDPETFYICHCKECQKQSASAFGMSLTVRRDETSILSGKMKVWKRRSDSRHELSCYFCPECGVRLFHARDVSPEIWNLKAGTLDDNRNFQPVGHIWLKSACSWVVIPKNSLCYDAQPSDKAALIKKWRQR